MRGGSEGGGGLGQGYPKKGRLRAISAHHQTPPPPPTQDEVTTQTLTPGDGIRHDAMFNCYIELTNGGPRKRKY